MKLTFLGHSCFLLETGTHRLLLDPFLTGNPVAPVKAEEIVCDFILISHGHGDHVGDAVAIARRTGARIIANHEIATFCGKQGVEAHGMSIGGSRAFPFGRVKLTIAHHGSGYETADGILYMGSPAGFLITAADKVVYHSGDTGLFLDMQLIGQRHAIDVALLPIGDNYTMGIADAVQAVEFLQPRIVIPMHYNTFPVIAADPREFAERLAGGKTRVVILNPGEHFEF
ncbi:MAG: metal-dependent hydrolase [candidate division KSB1 bacterium]|nr:metal-dependent hydrolase [candidate division KSB1 bacterium]MDZ7272747.1 metal-dependent hydrolase [candidate division KSB1 bacterium]MDZ7284228.1 metal-dependent hydrolase [candidate division KSB1 bacterium]MDZ7297373.1 metal-dependent hydrolase [candidate division KSB1 bacterium]MDZ7309053.1 metal-dependent hydrolase [candidate division KSB1 bacterium]